jgi:hypothetical protein
MTDPIDAAIAYEHDRQHAAQPSDYAELVETARDFGRRSGEVDASQWPRLLPKLADAIEDLEAELKFRSTRLHEWASGEVIHADHAKERDKLKARAASMRELVKDTAADTTRTKGKVI